MTKIDSLKNLPVENQIHDLGKIVGGIATNRVMNDDMRSVYGNKPKNGEADYREHYENIQREVFMALQEMPSAEAIRVLGEFLSDDRGGQEYEQAPASEPIIVWGPHRNCDMAVIALFKLIENAPPGEKGHQPFVNVNAWQRWYQQVKEGRRTVRFKAIQKIIASKAPLQKQEIPMCLVPQSVLKRPPQQKPPLLLVTDRTLRGSHGLRGFWEFLSRHFISTSAPGAAPEPDLVMKRDWILIAWMNALVHAGNLHGATDDWVATQRKIIEEARQSRSDNRSSDFRRFLPRCYRVPVA